MLTEENFRAGIPQEEAQRAALLKLGGIQQVKEQVREERVGNWFRSVIADCLYGLRQSANEKPGSITQKKLPFKGMLALRRSQCLQKWCLTSTRGNFFHGLDLAISHYNREIKIVYRRANVAWKQVQRLPDAWTCGSFGD